jgi:hypothetical protein
MLGLHRQFVFSPYLRSPPTRVGLVGGQHPDLPGSGASGNAHRFLGQAAQTHLRTIASRVGQGCFSQ